MPDAHLEKGELFYLLKTVQNKNIVRFFALINSLFTYLAYLHNNDVLQFFKQTNHLIKTLRKVDIIMAAVVNALKTFVALVAKVFNAFGMSKIWDALTELI